MNRGKLLALLGRQKYISSLEQSKIDGKMRSDLTFFMFDAFYNMFNANFCIV